MYQSEQWAAVLKARRAFTRQRVSSRLVGRTVLLLGLTSFFTDISSEMVSTVLPLYLVFTLHLTPLQFGLVDGLYLGAAALMRVASGFVADRLRHHKLVALTGYALSAVCKIGLLVAGGSWGALSGVILVDRLGKGIRTAPRDALIARDTPQEELGVAFGVHRALDTAGAMIGPLLAFALLALVPAAYDAIFAVSFCVALIGLGILGFFVDDRTPEPAPRPQSRDVSLAAVLGLLRQRRFQGLTVLGAALGLFTISDGFLYLGLQRSSNIAVSMLPLFYVATAFIYMVLAVPAGRLADRVGRHWVFLGGYSLLLLAYTALLSKVPGPAAIALFLLLLGAYYAATDGVLMALASEVLPTELRASGLAILSTATSLARLCAAVVFGALWTWRSIAEATGIYLAGLGGVLLIAAYLLGRHASRNVHAHGS